MQTTKHLAVVPPMFTDAIVLLDGAGKELIKDDSGNWVVPTVLPITRTVVPTPGFYTIFNKNAQEWHTIGFPLLWGKMAEEIVGQSQVPRKVNLWKYTDPPAFDGTSTGAWSQVFSSGSTPVQFYVVDRVIPSTKKLTTNMWVGAAPVTHKVYSIVACDCPVGV